MGVVVMEEVVGEVVVVVEGAVMGVVVRTGWVEGVTWREEREEAALSVGAV